MLLLLTVYLERTKTTLQKGAWLENVNNANVKTTSSSVRKQRMYHYRPLTS